MSIEEYFLQEKPEIEEEPKILFARPDLLLHPNIPKPLHGLAPRTLLGSKWWDIERRKAYANNNYHCWACNTYAAYNHGQQKFEALKLHAHEHYDIDYEEYSMELVEIVALCPTCHDYIHSGRMNALYDKGVLNEQDCWEIRNHGDRVLGYRPVRSRDGTDYRRSWDKWTLILKGVEVKGKFKNYEEWEEHYRG